MARLLKTLVARDANKGRWRQEERTISLRFQGLGMGGRAADMLDAMLRQPLGEGVRDEPRPIVRQQLRTLA